MAKYDGLLGQPILEVEEPDKEGGITFILKITGLCLSNQLTEKLKPYQFQNR